MAAKPKAKPAAKAASVAATSAPAPAAAATPSDALHGVLAVLGPLCDAHRAQLEIPPVDHFVPGATIHAHAHHPVSAERFVEAARACAGVSVVQVLPTGVRLVVVIPAEG